MTFAEKHQKPIDWLLQGDISIKYQTLRDLTDASEKDQELARSLILSTGWGGALMDLQDQSHLWSMALYSPKWTSTFYTLLLLKRFGSPLDPRIEKACVQLLDHGYYEPDGGINYWKSWKQGESCVTGMLLSILCFFRIEDKRILKMVQYLLEEQMFDRGWNCERYRGAKHSSFHTTISVLEGLWEFERICPDKGYRLIVSQAQKEGIEFLLRHHLYKSNSTWEAVDPQMTKMIFPPRWHFDILRCFDYFQSAGVEWDERMSDAFNIILNKKTLNGSWKLQAGYAGKTFFKMEKPGTESRWITLISLRILKWWESYELELNSR